MERQTTAFGPTETAPSTAYDMGIESPPTSDDATKWKLFLPAFAYDRGGTSPKTSRTDRKNLAEVGGDTAACPVPAMKMTVMTKADQLIFDAYIVKVQARDLLYHRPEWHKSVLQSP